MIVGFGYRKGTGKDQSALHLMKKYGFNRRAFADSLKNACQMVFMFTEAQVRGELKEVTDPFWGVTPRLVLQLVGTECFRKGFAHDVWIRSLHCYVKEHSRPYDLVVPDVRFPDEADAIKSWGGIVIRLDRGDSSVRRWWQFWKPKLHASECSMDGYKNWDHVINNNGTVKELNAELDKIMVLHGKGADTHA